MGGEVTVGLRLLYSKVQMFLAVYNSVRLMRLGVLEGRGQDPLPKLLNSYRVWRPFKDGKLQQQL